MPNPYSDRQWAGLGPASKKKQKQCVDCPAMFTPRGPTNRCQPCQGAHMERRAKERNQGRKR